MRKFAAKTLLTIVVPVVVLLVAYEAAMRSIPNDYSYKSALWEKNASGIKVLVLGNSHCFYGFNPDWLDKPAFNASHPSQTYNYDWFLFDKYFDRMDSLECVILPLSCFSPFTRLEDGTEAWHCKDYAIFYGCRFHRWYELRQRYYFPYLSIDNLHEALSHLFDRSYNNLHVDSNGYAPKMASDRIDDLAKDGMEAALRHTIADLDKVADVYEENLSYCKDIILRCRERGVRVVFVTTPTLPEYYTHLDPRQVKAMEDFGHQMEQYDNVKYLNLLQSPLFDTCDFFNSDHLCASGAQKLTSLLNVKN